MGWEESAGVLGSPLALPVQAVADVTCYCHGHHRGGDGVKPPLERPEESGITALSSCGGVKGENGDTRGEMNNPGVIWGF